jgi:hypothetical protein
MKSKLKYPFLLSILATMSLRTLFGNEHPTNADPVGAVRSAKQILSVESGGDTTKGMSLAGKRPNTKLIKAPDPATEFLVGAGLVALSVVRRRLRGTGPKT